MALITRLVYLHHISSDYCNCCTCTRICFWPSAFFSSTFFLFSVIIPAPQCFLCLSVSVADKKRSTGASRKCSNETNTSQKYASSCSQGCLFAHKIDVMRGRTVLKFRQILSGSHYVIRFFRSKLLKAEFSEWIKSSRVSELVLVYEAADLESAFVPERFPFVCKN